MTELLIEEVLLEDGAFLVTHLTYTDASEVVQLVMAGQSEWDSQDILLDMKEAHELWQALTKLFDKAN